MLTCLLGFGLKHSTPSPIFLIFDLVGHETIFLLTNFCLVHHLTTLIFESLAVYVTQTPLPLLPINSHLDLSLVFSLVTLPITVDTAAMIRSFAVC